MEVSGVLAIQELAQDLVSKWGEANVHRQTWCWHLRWFEMTTTMFRFNSVTLETERPSILGPGFTAPPGGPEYLNRNAIGIKLLVLSYCNFRGRKTPSACWHCRPGSFCASGKFLRAQHCPQKQVKTLHKFLDSLESFLTVWKVSIQSGKCPDSLESFWIVLNFLAFWKISWQSGKLLDSLESFLTV